MVIPCLPVLPWSARCSGLPHPHLLRSARSLPWPAHEDRAASTQSVVQSSLTVLVTCVCSPGRLAVLREAGPGSAWFALSPRARGLRRAQLIFVNECKNRWATGVTSRAWAEQQHSLALWLHFPVHIHMGKLRLREARSAGQNPRAVPPYRTPPSRLSSCLSQKPTLPQDQQPPEALTGSQERNSLPNSSGLSCPSPGEGPGTRESENRFLTEAAGLAES